MREKKTRQRGPVQSFLNSIEVAIASHVKRFEAGQTKKKNEKSYYPTALVLFSSGFRADGWWLRQKEVA